LGFEELNKRIKLILMGKYQRLSVCVVVTAYDDNDNLQKGSVEKKKKKNNN
jgi:hypothetical protein